MPAWTLKCVTGSPDTEELEAACALVCKQVPWVAHCFVSSARDKKGGSLLLTEEKKLHRFLGKAGSCVIARIGGNGVSFGPDLERDSRVDEVRDT